MITATSSTPTNASASLWPGNSAKLRLTQPVTRRPQLIGTVSATVAAWFVRRHSEPGTQPADVASVDTEPAAATTVDTRAALLDRIEGLAAKQDEIHAMLIELQRPPTSY